MGKILLSSDIHVHTHKNSLKRLQHCLDALEWIFKTAVEKDIEDVIFLGDLFQDREKIQVLSYQKAYEIIRKYCGDNKYNINLYLLVGNHDMWYADKTDISSVKPFDSINRVKVISDLTTLNIAGVDIDFLPFTLNPIKSIEFFSQSKSPVLCGHAALDGAQINTFYRTHADISVEYDGDVVKVDSGVFSRWQRVLLGHYHGAQIINNVEYVGSPLQLNFAEAFQEKHIVVLDTETLDEEYVVNTFSPQHVILNADDVYKYDLNNTFVKIIAKDIGSSNIVDIKNDVMTKYDILSIEFSSPKVSEDQESKEMVESAQTLITQDRGEMLEDYLKSVKTPAGLEYNKLLEVGRNLSQKTMME